MIGDGSLKAQVHVVEGIENAGQAMIDMLQGASLGKTVVRIAHDPTA